MKKKKFHMNKIMSRNPCAGLSAVLEQAASVHERLPHTKRNSYSWAIGQVLKLVGQWYPAYDKFNEKVGQWLWTR